MRLPFGFSRVLPNHAGPLLVVQSYILFACWGFLLGTERDATLIGLLLALMIAATVSLWCVLDGSSRGQPVIHSYRWMLFFLWPAGVPAYLVWSRRWQGFLLAMANVFLAYTVTWLGFGVGYYAGINR